MKISTSRPYIQYVWILTRKSPTVNISSICETSTMPWHNFTGQLNCTFIKIPYILFTQYSLLSPQFLTLKVKHLYCFSNSSWSQITETITLLYQLFLYYTHTFCPFYRLSATISPVTGIQLYWLPSSGTTLCICAEIHVQELSCPS